MTAARLDKDAAVPGVVPCRRLIGHSQRGGALRAFACALAESEAAGGATLAFVVDGTTLGKCRIMVIGAATDILDGLRPTAGPGAPPANAAARVIALPCG